MVGKTRAGGWGVRARANYILCCTIVQCNIAQLVLPLRRGDPPLPSWPRRARVGVQKVHSQSGNLRVWIELNCAALCFCLLLFWVLSRGVGRFCGGARDGRWIVCARSPRDLERMRLPCAGKYCESCGFLFLSFQFVWCLFFGSFLSLLFGDSKWLPCCLCPYCLCWLQAHLIVIRLESGSSCQWKQHLAPKLNIYQQRQSAKGKNIQKHTTIGIRWWSPTASFQEGLNIHILIPMLPYTL